jgi:hypothetical protein
MLEMDYNLILHVAHVSGKRMIWQGSDGLSCVDHSQGIMMGATMESFILLHLSAISRGEDCLCQWLSNITRGLIPVPGTKRVVFNGACKRKLHMVAASCSC